MAASAPTNIATTIVTNNHSVSRRTLIAFDDSEHSIDNKRDRLMMSRNTTSVATSRHQAGERVNTLLFNQETDSSMQIPIQRTINRSSGDIAATKQPTGEPFVPMQPDASQQNYQYQYYYYCDTDQYEQDDEDEEDNEDLYEEYETSQFGQYDDDDDDEQASLMGLAGVESGELLLVAGQTELSDQQQQQNFWQPSLADSTSGCQPIERQQQLGGSSLSLGSSSSPSCASSKSPAFARPCSESGKLSTLKRELLIP